MRLAVSRGVRRRRSFQECRQRGSQRHWAHWLVHQMITKRPNLTEAIRSRVAADEESGHGFPKRAADSLDRRDADLAIGQLIVSDDQIRGLVMTDHSGQGGAI